MSRINVIIIASIFALVGEVSSTASGPVVIEPIKRSDFDDPNLYQDQPSFPQSGRSFSTSISNNKRGSLRIGSTPSATQTRWPTYDSWPSSSQTSNNEVPLKHTVHGQVSPTPIADSIKCTGGHSSSNPQSFTANITPPPGFANVPVFEDAPSVIPSMSEDCSMKPIGNGNFGMKISNFIKCGVTTQKGNDGKEWLAVSIRFPFVGGLRTSDDEHVMIMCRPQERTISKSHSDDDEYTFELEESKDEEEEIMANFDDDISGEKEINHRLNIFDHFRSQGPKTVFSGGSSEFETKVTMFTRKSNSMNFNEELARNSLIEVGQDLQFKASVRSGDGWKYAKLKDLTIQKMSKNNKNRSDDDDSSNNKKRRGSRPKESSSPTPDSAYLVLEDGCRNPIYTAIAPKHPGVDPHNPLVVTFSFRAFMFQDMLDGDTLRISAKIMACQEQVDCQPGLCLDDDQPGYGRRKRSVPERIRNITAPSAHPNEITGVHDWTRDFELNVVMPGYAKAFALTTNDLKEMKSQGTGRRQDVGDQIGEATEIESSVSLDRERKNDCRAVVIYSTFLSLLFVTSTSIAALVAISGRKERKSGTLSINSWLHTPVRA